MDKPLIGNLLLNLTYKMSTTQQISRMNRKIPLNSEFKNIDAIWRIQIFENIFLVEATANFNLLIALQQE